MASEKLFRKMLLYVLQGCTFRIQFGCCSDTAVVPEFVYTYDLIIGDLNNVIIFVQIIIVIIMHGNIFIHTAVNCLACDRL